MRVCVCVCVCVCRSDMVAVSKQVHGHTRDGFTTQVARACATVDSRRRAKL